MNHQHRHFSQKYRVADWKFVTQQPGTNKDNGQLAKMWLVKLLSVVP